MTPEEMAFVEEHYEIHEWRHARAILERDFPEEWSEIVAVLAQFRLLRSDILTPGGGKSPISAKIDGALADLGWKEKSFDTKILVDDCEMSSPTHGVDCIKSAVGLEIEWNNKDPFYDRDLNNFRLLFELRALSVGVVVTRSDELQSLFNELGKGASYGASTTHMGKLIPKLEGGGGGGCPVLVFGITRRLYVED